ncbi:MAG: cupredoxin domain-containing protein [Candidatus Hydrothermarchaeales archaeon]
MVKRRDFLKGMLLGAAAATFPSEVLAQKRNSGVKEFHIKLSGYKYEPSVIKVKQGDRVRLLLEGMDIEHGFYIDGYDLDIKVRHAEVKTLEFVADRPGAFKIRCSVVCGPLHPFMTGKLVVEPNLQFLASLGLSLIMPFAALIFMHLLDRRREDGK